MLKGERWVPPDLEVAHLPHMMGHPYGGLFLFSQSARMMRPVRYWAGGGGLELIGTLEQVRGGGGLFTWKEAVLSVCGRRMPCLCAGGHRHVTVQGAVRVLAVGLHKSMRVDVEVD
jgi:hypothetical protein